MGKTKESEFLDSSFGKFDVHRHCNPDNSDQVFLCVHSAVNRGLLGDNAPTQKTKTEQGEAEQPPLAALSKKSPVI